MRIGSTLLILLQLLVMTAGMTHARSAAVLDGSATLGVQSYSGESAGETQKGQSFYQQYAMTLRQDGKFYNGRAGAYTLMLGYEINRLNPTFDYNGVRDPDINAIGTEKFYYNGNLVIAPGGLPFRLHLYARDTQKSSFVSNGLFNDFATGNQSVAAGQTIGHLLSPDIYNDLNNGTARTLGANLLIGIRNGSYLGAYRDVLSQLPRLLVDFQQQEVKDLHSPVTRTHYRSRDLAFVSLNKKDNWVHFRMRDHSDFLNPENDTLTRQTMIGTIDHLLNRQWINLTNWIKLSGELSYSAEKKVDVDPINTYQLNLLLLGERQNVSSSLLSQFLRENDGKYITREAEVPLAVNIEFNRDTRLRSRFIFDAKESSSIFDANLNTVTNANGDRRGHTDFYLDNHLELRRSQRVTLSPRIEIEGRRQEASKDGLALRVGSEVASNSKLSKSLNWLGGYALTAIRTNDEIAGTSGSFLQNEVYGRIDKDLSRSLRVGGRSKLEVGSGEGRADIGFRIPTMSGGVSNARGNNAVANDYDGMLVAGNISLYLDHRYQRLGNRLELGYEFFTADEIDSKRVSLEHTLNYTERRYRLNWVTKLNIGDSSASPESINFDYLGGAIIANSDSNTSTWSSNLNYRYDPSRSLGLTLDAGISGTQADENYSSYRLAERLDYRIFTSNGIIRKLAEFSEELGYEKVSTAINGRDSNFFGRLSAAYFPTKHLYAKVSSEVVAYLSSSSMQQISTGEFGLDFEKLKFMAIYSQGYKEEESDLLPEVKEKRWEVKVKKIF